jgi:phosphoglycolate phosphatase
MSEPLRLVVFDVDGTLVDSQGHIVSSMNAAFSSLDHPVPTRAAVLDLVGLSLEVSMLRLAPTLGSKDHALLVQAYKDAYMAERDEAGTALSSPLYEGALACLHHLNALPNVVLGVATGKSKRGLDKLIEGHSLEGLFVTQQVADFHPSKPHPAMLHTAIADAGVDVENTIMVGDTSFDMEMAKGARVRSVGVKWGYHSADKLQTATRLVDTFDQLQLALNEMWGDQT